MVLCLVDRLCMLVGGIQNAALASHGWMAERICSGICPYGDVRDEDGVDVGMFLSRYLNKL